MSTLTNLFGLIAAGDHAGAETLLEATPALVTAGLSRADEYFLAERRAQVYEGDTALHRSLTTLSSLGNCSHAALRFGHGIVAAPNRSIRRRSAAQVQRPGTQPNSGRSSSV
jgi:hypothetical protein